MKKPEWLIKDKSVMLNRDMKKLLREHNLHTVCESARCPNITECFTDNTSTLMIFGDICTRSCSFCGVQKGKPLDIDPKEEENILKVIEKLKLKYIVLTMVTRDDLFDGGAFAFAKIVKKIKDIYGIKVEILTSDFYSKQTTYESDLEKYIAYFINSGVDVFGHNMETVENFYPKIRPVFDYHRSLYFLKTIKKIDNKTIAKTAIMLGLGETKNEVVKTMQDILETGCDILTIGQYLMPSLKHFKLDRYITVEEFDEYKEIALNIGFRAVESGPFVRSSYKADHLYNLIKGA